LNDTVRYVAFEPDIIISICDIELMKYRMWHKNYIEYREITALLTSLYWFYVLELLPYY
jgi:hypothetical protein